MPTKDVRIIICSDVGNEVDDQFAIVHALLIPRLEVCGTIANFYRGANSVIKAEQKLVEISRLSGKQGDYPIVQGALDPLGASKVTGAELIVKTALSESSKPLYILCMAGLTDVALALRLAPQIAERMTVIWVGGGRYPQGSHEANLARDREAANEVMGSDCPVWQIPSGAYKQMQVSIPWLNWQLQDAGRLGDYLTRGVARFIDQHDQDTMWINRDVWVLGDSAAVGVLLDEQKGNYVEKQAPYFQENWTYDLKRYRDKRKIRVYQRLNSVMIVNDLIARLHLVVPL